MYMYVYNQTLDYTHLFPNILQQRTSKVTYICVVGFIGQQVGTAPPPEETHDRAAHLWTEGLAQLGTDGLLLHLTKPKHCRYQPVGQNRTEIIYCSHFYKEEKLINNILKSTIIIHVV